MRFRRVVSRVGAKLGFEVIVLDFGVCACRAQWSRKWSHFFKIVRDGGGYRRPPEDAVQKRQFV